VREALSLRLFPTLELLLLAKTFERLMCEVEFWEVFFI